METRLNVFEKGLPAMKPLFGIGAYLSKGAIEQHLLHLVYFRVSQINGCAYCLDMHSKDLRAIGESEQRLFVLDAWREAPFYTDRERAALAWAESVTILGQDYVCDDVYENARRQFSEQEMIDLTLAIIGINSFNRINIAFRIKAGSYQPGQHQQLINN